MKIKVLVFAGAVMTLAACASVPTSVPASAAEPAPEPATAETVSSPLAFLFGEWVGTAKGIGPDQQPYEVIQTERVGPMPGG